MLFLMGMSDMLFLVGIPYLFLMGIAYLFSPLRVHNTPYVLFPSGIADMLFPSGTTHETQVLGTRLGLFASIGQATTRNQVMTRG